jgi:hypothetical protein
LVNDSNRQIASAEAFEKYFTKPSGINEGIKRNSKLTDTINFLPKAIQASKHQVRLFCKHELNQSTVYDVCYTLWHWLYSHIPYHKDDEGKEQIRSPRRSFYDRTRGIDCDDYTVFISSCLCELKIPHVLVVAKYTQKNGYQHIYPIVPTSNGNYITMDCVTDKFNYEVPPLETLQKNMDLEFLDGIDANPNKKENTYEVSGIDAEDLLQGYEDMGELGKRLRDTKIAQKVKGSFQNMEKSKVYTKLRQGVHAINRVNPATALLRAGILASLKLNIMNVAGQLRYGYLSNEQAQAKGFDTDKFIRLQGIKNRLQKIFYGAGGKEENFKIAILTGRGNKNKEVMAGLGYIDERAYSQDNRLSQVLGLESYQSEMQDIQGVEGLGEPATGAAIAAATTVMTAIAGLLKGIGNLRKKSSPNGSDNTEQSNGSSENPVATGNSTDTPTSDPSQPSSQQSTDTTQDTSVNAKDGGDNTSSSNTKETPTDPSNTTDANSSSPSNQDDESGSTQRGKSALSPVKATEKVSLMVKTKKWVNEHKVATGAIALTALSLVTWAVVAYTKNNTPKKKKKENLGAVPKHAQNKYAKHYGKQNQGKNQSNKQHPHFKIKKLK